MLHMVVAGGERSAGVRIDVRALGTLELRGGKVFGLDRGRGKEEEEEQHLSALLCNFTGNLLRKPLLEIRSGIQRCRSTYTHADTYK